MTCGNYSHSILPNYPSFHDGPSGKLLSSKSNPDSRIQASYKLDSCPEYKAGTETILLVEDMESLRVVITDSLEQLGYKVLTASNGESALALSAAYKGEIHLLLTDVIMPQMKGPELAQRMMAERPRLKVIYVSGYAEGVLAPHGVFAPGIVLLYKPFSIKALSTKLREVLGG